MDVDAESRKMKHLIAPVYITIVCLSLAWASVLPAFPQYLAALGAGFSLTGVVIGMKSIGQMTSDVPGGLFLSRYGIRRISLVMYASTIVANGLIYFTRSLPVLAVIVFLSGFFSSVLLTGSMAIVRTFVPASHRGRALSLAGGSLRIGMLFGPTIGGMIAQRFGMPTVFLFRTIILVVAMATFALSYRDVPAASGPQGSPLSRMAAVMEGLKDRRKAVIVVGLGILILMILRTSREFIVPLWGGELGISPSRIGFAMSIAGAFDLLLFLPAGYISDRFGRKIAVSLCLGGFTVGLVLLYLSSGVVGFVIAISVVGIGNGLGAGINMTTGTDLAPRNAISEFLGLWRLYGDLGASLGPVLVGALSAAVGLGTSALVLVALGVLGVAIMLGPAPETRDIGVAEDAREGR